MKWHEQIAVLTGSNHSDTLAVVRAGKKAKKRSNRRERRTMFDWQACADHGINLEFCTSECDLSTEEVFDTKDA